METLARRITARRESFSATRVARERPCLIGGCTCRNPGLVKITRPCGRTAGFPTRPPFQTKHELAAQVVEKIMADVRLKARWVVCDEGFGDAPAFLQRLAGAGLWYVAEVPRDTKVWPLLEADGQTPRARPSSWVPPQTRSRKGPVPRRERLHPASPAKVPLEELAQQWPSSAWQSYRLLEGHKGPLVADFLVLRAVLPLDRLPGPEVWVVIRRKVSGSVEEPEWKFYLSNAPLETELATFVRVSGMRWPIETCFAECKGELGMDHYELRFWHGWHHHMTLVFLAHHFLVRGPHRLNLRGLDTAPHDFSSLSYALCVAMFGLSTQCAAECRSGTPALADRAAAARAGSTGGVGPNRLSATSQTCRLSVSSQTASCPVADTALVKSRCNTRITS